MAAVVRRQLLFPGAEKWLTPGVCRREESSHVESTTYEPLRVAKCLYVIDSTLVDIFIPTDSWKSSSSSLTRSIREAGITGASGGTSKVGKRREDLFGGVRRGTRPRRAKLDKTFPSRSPELRDRCIAAW